eukprot:676883-Hanusia_phi.AAC.1
MNRSWSTGALAAACRFLGVNDFQVRVVGSEDRRSEEQPEVLTYFSLPALDFYLLPYPLHAHTTGRCE